MPRAVKFERYGGVDVLRVVEVDRPMPGPEQVLIRMKAAGINPGEAAIREGALRQAVARDIPLGTGQRRCRRRRGSRKRGQEGRCRRRGHRIHAQSFQSRRTGCCRG